MPDITLGAGESESLSSCSTCRLLPLPRFLVGSGIAEASPSAAVAPTDARKHQCIQRDIKEHASIACITFGCTIDQGICLWVMWT